MHEITIGGWGFYFSAFFSFVDYVPVFEALWDLYYERRIISRFIVMRCYF